MAAVRRATVSWTGDLATGQGSLSAASSHAFSDLPVTWGSRIEQADGRTSPEELLAAAHASCFSMAFSSELAKAGFTAEHLDVTAEVTFDRVDGRWTVISSALIVRGRVPGMDEDRFRSLAEVARDGCPISRALAGSVSLSVDAALEVASTPQP
jgi:osmotically inducible protein OsmC